jgi:hypothetical protein
LRKSEERDEVDAYMKREQDGARFSLADVMSGELGTRDQEDD